MTQPKKTARFTRSREDYDLFRVTLPHYDPTVMKALRLHLGPNQYLHPDTPFATIFFHPPKNKSEDASQMINEEGLRQQLTTTMRGCVQRIGSRFTEVEGRWQLCAGVGKSMLQLMWIRQCQHLLQKQSINDSDITNQSGATGPQKCPRCGKEIYFYYYSEVQTVTADDFLKFHMGLELEDLTELQWSIIINEQFTPTTKIMKIKDEQYSYPALAKAVYLLGQGQKPNYSQPLMKIRRIFCKHQKQEGGRCQLCLAQIDMTQKLSFHRYLFQFGPKGTKVALSKGFHLAKQEQEYLQGLMNNKKLILILDLDNTILHSTQMNELQYHQVLSLKEYLAIPKYQQFEEKLRFDYIIVKLRPFLKEFLFALHDIYEIYIYTKGTRIYATQICRLIRQQWTGQKRAVSEAFSWPEPPLSFLNKTQAFLPYRIVSRNQDTSLDTKSMQTILPTNKAYHVILDDRRDVWNNSPSWFYTRDYFYFLKKSKSPEEEDIEKFLREQESSPLKEKIDKVYHKMRQDYPNKKDYQIEFNNKADYFLAFAARSLRKIHSRFFELNTKIQDQTVDNKLGKVTSVAQIMVQQKAYFYKKKFKCFLVPGDEEISITRRIIKLGGKKCEKDKPDYVIRGNGYFKYLQKKRTVDATISKKKTTQMQGNNSNNEASTSQSKITSEQIKEIGDQKNKKDVKIDPSFQQQVQTFVKNQIPIISQTWILASYEYSFPFSHKDFVLKDPLQIEVDHSHFNESISKVGEKVAKQIQDRMQRELKKAEEKSKVQDKQ